MIGSILALKSGNNAGWSATPFIRSVSSYLRALCSHSSGVLLFSDTNIYMDGKRKSMSQSPFSESLISIYTSFHDLDRVKTEGVGGGGGVSVDFLVSPNDKLPALLVPFLVITFL